MRVKHIAAPMLVVGLLGIGPESLPPTHEAAHRAPRECDEQVFEFFGGQELLLDAVEVNIQLAYEKNYRTSHDNNRVLTDEFVETLQDRGEYIDQNTEKLGRYTLQKSGIVVELHGDSDWTLDAEKFESTLEQAYRVGDPEDPLQTAVNICIADLVFNERRLAESLLLLRSSMHVTVLGDGDICIARTKVKSRSDGINCPTSGRTSRGLWGQYIYIAPGSNEKTSVEEWASYTLAHEVDHWIRNSLDARADTKKKFEYAAYELGKAYRKIAANDPDHAVLRLHN